VVLVTNTTKRTPQNIVKMLVNDLGYLDINERDVLTSMHMVKKKMREMQFRNPCVVLDERVREWFLDDEMRGLWDGRNSGMHDGIVIASNPRLLSDGERNLLVEAAKRYTEEMQANSNNSCCAAPHQIPTLFSTPLRGVTRTKMMEQFFNHKNCAEPQDLDEHPLEELFEHTQNVQVCGKPSPDIWLEACKLANCEPSEAIMLGDSIEADIVGALQLGMGAILVRSGKFDAAHEEIVHWMLQQDKHLVGIEDDFGDAAKILLEHL